MSNIVKRLTKEGIACVNHHFLSNPESSVNDEPKYCEAIKREIRLDRLNKVIFKTIEDLPQYDPKMDRILAPQIHMELGLTKREAADRDLWSYLTCVKYPNLVFHRWKPKKNGEVGYERFIDRRRNTLLRLWLVADLTNYKGDYSLTDEFFGLTDSQERLNAFFDRRISWTYDSAKVLIKTLGEKDREEFRRVFIRVRQILTTTVYESLNPSQFEKLITEIVAKS